jgi:hypothetical protein
MTLRNRKGKTAAEVDFTEVNSSPALAASACRISAR